MKRKVITALLAATMVASLAVGCGNKGGDSKSDSSKSSSSDEITIGFSQVGAESDWRTANSESMKSTFSEKNGYKLIFDDAQQKQENQLTAIRNFIQQEVDYIVLAPVTETGWDTVLQEAKDAGIPVIIVDRMVDVKDDSLYTAWVGSCTANGTDVFSGATGASKLSTYPKLNAGNLVDIIGESGTRYQVRIAAKYIGYVEKSNIKNPNTPAATTTKKYPFVGKVTASKLNVRKKPGTEHPLLPEYPMLNKDNLVNVLGVTKDTKGDRWYKVSITKNEYVGYVSAKYITKA